MIRKVYKLTKGDKVALITPAGPINSAKLSKAVSIVEKLGLKPIWGDKVHKHYGYLAGTDQERLQELIEAYTNPQIKAVFSIRGGYGTMRLLDKIPYKLIAKNPKLFLGFSDITALQMAFLKKARLPSLHVNLSSLEHEYTRKIFEQIVFQRDKPVLKFETDFTPKPNVIVAGQAEGQIVGGNLSLLSALCGTGYLPKFKGKIVFIEEINEPPYKIDKMLTQLFLATDIKKAKGIVFGIFNKCNRENFYKNIQDSLSLKQILLEKFSNFQAPVIGGFPLGHIDKMSILPIGAKVRLTTNPPQLEILTTIIQ